MRQTAAGRCIRYNEEHDITPETIVKAIQKKIMHGQVEDGKKLAVEGLEKAEVMDMVMELESEMHAAAGMKKVCGV